MADFGAKSATSNAPSADAGNEREMYDARSHLDEVISHIRSLRDKSNYRAANGCTQATVQIRRLACLRRAESTLSGNRVRARTPHGACTLALKPSPDHRRAAGNEWVGYQPYAIHTNPLEWIG